MPTLRFRNTEAGEPGLGERTHGALRPPRLDILLLGVRRNHRDGDVTGDADQLLQPVIYDQLHLSRGSG